MKHIELIARGVCVRSGSVLACRNDRRGYFYLPGGHVEHGEAATDALAREFREECGVTVSVGAFAFASENAFGSDHQQVHELNLAFHVELDSAEVLSREPGISFHWLEIASLLSVDFRPESARAWLVSGGGVGPEWISEIPRKVDSE